MVPQGWLQPLQILQAFGSPIGQEEWTAYPSWQQSDTRYRQKLADRLRTLRTLFLFIRCYYTAMDFTDMKIAGLEKSIVVGIAIIVLGVLYGLDKVDGDMFIALFTSLIGALGITTRLAIKKINPQL